MVAMKTGERLTSLKMSFEMSTSVGVSENTRTFYKRIRVSC